MTVAHPETRVHGADARVFLLIEETRDWVEATFEPPHEGAHATRSAPYALGRALVTRGLVGELLAQEYLEAFPNGDEIELLAREVDALRTEADETRWTEERRARIAEAEERLEDAVYAAPFPLRVVLTLLTYTLRDELSADFHALNLPRGLVVDAVLEPGAEFPLMRRRLGERT